MATKKLWLPYTLVRYLWKENPYMERMCTDEELRAGRANWEMTCSTLFYAARANPSETGAWGKCLGESHLIIISWARQKNSPWLLKKHPGPDCQWSYVWTLEKQKNLYMVFLKSCNKDKRDLAKAQNQGTRRSTKPRASYHHPLKAKMTAIGKLAGRKEERQQPGILPPGVVDGCLSFQV